MLAPPTDMETLKKNSVVTGHHIYKTIWTPFIWEMLPAEIEEGNVYDRYAISLTRDGKIVGHMPCSISKVSWHFLKHGGKIKCEALDFEVSSATCTAWSLKLVSKLWWLSLDAAIIITRGTMWHIDHTQALFETGCLLCYFSHVEISALMLACLQMHQHPCIHASQVFTCTTMMLTLDIYSWQMLIQSILLVEEIIMAILYSRNV